MTEQEKQWFDELATRRVKLADAFDDPAARGIWGGIVDKYSDQAHFIYELLQNADDVKATTATFRLEESGLYFTHNGSVRFTISNPQNEEADTNNGTLGHINAITSIANSNKTEASIGKFGVGFKAVFQYTQTPHIYDPEIRFKIERFIVPHMLDADLDWRNSSKTVFFFPFDHKKKQPQESHDEILEKLKALEFPVLFLSSLKSVSFEAEKVSGKYTKKVTRKIEEGGITAQWITLALKLDGKRTSQRLVMFTRNNASGHPCSIGYALGESGNLVPIDRTAFCFFPTKEATNLNFILHAPFLLTDSREGIKAGEKHNNELIEQLAELAANSLPILRDEKLIDDGILDIIPYDEARFSELGDRRIISFKPFYTAFNSKLQTEALLPSTDNLFAESKNAYWASVPRIAQLISNKQLAHITNNKNARWVFTSFGRDECLRKNKEIATYIDEVICTWLDEKDILTGWKGDGGKSFDGISADFIKKQPHDWLFNFYQWLSETKTRTEITKNRKIFIDSVGNAVASYGQDGKLILFLPDNDGDGYTTLSSKLFSKVEKILQRIDSTKTQTAKEFFDRFGIRGHTVKDEIESAIEKMKKGEIPADNFLIKSFKYFKDECPQNEIEEFISKIRSLAFLPYETKIGKTGFSSGQGLYFPTPRLVSFYVLRPETKFVAWETLRARYPESDHETLKNFLGKLGVNSQEPSKRDEVYNIILPQWRQNQKPDNTVDEGLVHFKTFFDYFTSLSQYLGDTFLRDIIELPFLLCSTKQDSEKKCFWGKSANIYLPTDDLKVWFETKPDSMFLLLDKYYKTVDEEDRANLMGFFDKLGVRKTPSVLSRTISPAELGNQRVSWSGKHHEFEDKYLDGCQQVIENINATRSVLLWRVLATTVQLHGLRGRHTWFYYSHQSEYFKSTEEQRLLTAKWILNKAGELVSADAVTIQSLSDQYDTTSAGAEALIRFLGIHDEAQDTAHLNEEERRKIALAEKIEKSGYSPEQILSLIEDDKRTKAAQTSTVTIGGGSEQTSPGSTLIQEIQKRRPSVKHDNSSGRQENDPTPPTQPSDANEDADDYTPKAVDYGKKLDRAKDRYASELDRIEREQVLHDKANTLPRYSYGWFLALLELECMASSEKNADGKTISISFGKVERNSQSSRTIVLKEPSRFIPQSIEEFSGVRVDLDFGNGRTGTLHVESFTAREFSLLGKLASAGELSGIDLGEVLEARIEVQNPSFLLQELLERFRELRLAEKFDMKASLTPDIEFVFGPPGTGKTTHLAEKVLIPMMQATEQARVLVLTPTNKAADVLTTRIMEKMGADTSFLNWLVRFGTSADERIEKAGVWRDRSFDIGALPRSVTVTTIARFAYDGLAVEYGSKKLHEMEWDAIVIDEASMISLASIIYPLYRQKPRKFIVAGDPFQIEPIVAVEQWKDENIYTLVGLNKPGAFAKPATKPHDYLVTNLETQYRSIPAIGEIFSRFTYDGILKHHRATGTQRPLELDGLAVQPLNLIKFPVSKYESIYRAKRLESGTPYQTYSALFTFEFVRWLAEQIRIGHENKFRIGVIAPYRAQANLLSRLNDSWAYKPDVVEIQVGTIHGFQGDECDIIIAVFNPPPTISSSPQMFLNKRSILNVAISRARDYLFIIMPDDETEGLRNLHKIAKIEGLVKSGGAFGEYASRTIEEMIWGNANYLEENTFSTGHQMVNIYRNPERYYEVRSDDSAIDVQIHGKQ
ncbi:DEAD/DEAH box helicase [Methylomicrobium album]|uniref:UvrD/REP helicase n=1 Tax=Methylomicrobium album BG8 TaxID=686340 RepID=H8GPN9_METAL|nr:DEAD/DEAH box helicase [Methylomicrobium album]EIC28501.1 UvrD/REP helicase [Methylomicrobium album BG8]